MYLSAALQHDDTLFSLRTRLQRNTSPSLVRSEVGESSVIPGKFKSPCSFLRGDENVIDVMTKITRGRAGSNSGTFIG